MDWSVEKKWKYNKELSHLRSTIQAFYYFWLSNLALSLGDKLTARMEPFFTFCTCKLEAMLWHVPCVKYWNACNFKHRLFFYKDSFYGEKQWNFYFRVLLKMSPHDRHIKVFPARIYTMQYACHICKCIDPTFISISLFWAFHISHKDLMKGGGVHMIFATALSETVEIYIFPLLSYKLTIPSSQLKFEKHIKCNPPSFGWMLIIWKNLPDTGWNSGFAAYSTDCIPSSWGNCCLNTAWVWSIIVSLSHPSSKLPSIRLFSTNCMVSGSWRLTITGSGVDSYTDDLWNWFHIKGRNAV